MEGTAPGTEARAGRMRTAHGDVETPAFMPVGTRGTVRGQTWTTLRAAGSRVLLANTLHLMRRPGADVVARLGGLHRFIGWDGPILTDSGGYQVFSLPGCVVDDDGATLPDPNGGPAVRLDPETSLAVQRALGSDIAMAFDHCVPATADRATAAQAVARTHAWALRSLAARGDGPQALFAIVQGACFPDLREASAAGLVGLPFDGYALGGLAVGESRSEREDTTAHAAALLPADRPRYLMGVGTPLDLLEAVHRGMDLFDCVLPTAHAQRGLAYTSAGRLDLRRGVYRLAEEPLDPTCACPTCVGHSRAYLHHLVKCEEVLAWQALGEHNLHHTHRLMATLRARVRDGTFAAYHAEARERLGARDAEHPPRPPGRRNRRPGPPRALGDYTIHEGVAGAAVRQRSSGETMHSVNDPVAEARALYVIQPDLPGRLAQAGPPLVVWDVGLGAATNAMAGIAAATGAARGLHLVSFERDLDALRLAVQHPSRFAHLRHPAPHALLRDGRWARDGVDWELRLGEAPDTFAGAPAPDVVWWDPFSAKVDGPMWTPAVFGRLRACCPGPTALFTYSTSTAVRAALLAAGFYVARGAPTGPKEQTTAAFTDRASAAGFALLDRAWLAKWEHSPARVPAGVDGVPAFVDAVRSHPQFA